MADVDPSHVAVSTTAGSATRQWNDTPLEFPEALRWFEGRLWCSDVRRREVLTGDPGGDATVVARFDESPNGIGFLPDGDIVAALMFSRRLVRIDRSGAVTLHADLSHVTERLVNDLVVDAAGNVFVGCRGAQPGADAVDQVRVDSIARVDVAGRVSVVASDDLDGPNGMAIAAGEERLIVAETGAHRVSQYDINSDGTLGDRRLFVELGDVAPDGITLDQDGKLWVAAPFSRRVVHVGPGGVERVVEPIDHGQPLSCTLGGPDGCTLFFSSVVPAQDGALTAWLFSDEPAAAPATPSSIQSVGVDRAGRGSP